MPQTNREVVSRVEQTMTSTLRHMVTQEDRNHPKGITLQSARGESKLRISPSDGGALGPAAAPPPSCRSSGGRR